MIEAIQTNFDGIRYRSRIEARWAVFFKAMNVRFEYEPEGYNFGEAGMYLPDFWLPDHRMFVEIKGDIPNPRERKMADLLAVETEKPVFILYGPIPDPKHYRNDSGELHLPDGIGGAVTDNGYRWSECAKCGHVDLCYNARLRFHHHGCTAEPMLKGDETPRIVAALEAARAARFEHGETSKVQALAEDIRNRTTPHGAGGGR